MKLVLLFFLTINVFAQSVSEIDGLYYFDYDVLAQEGALEELRWEFEKIQYDNYFKIFGLEEKHGELINIKEGELINSHFELNNGTLYLKYEKIVNDSMEFTKPIYDKVKAIFQKYNLTRREEIELIMRFLQDIPYYIPPQNFKSKYVMGFFPPSELLRNGKGDCDSKSVLMATILAHSPFYRDKLAVINVPGHALLGIEYPPSTYDKYIDFAGKTYVYSEPVGPARTPFGQVNSPYSTGIEVFPINVNRVLFTQPKRPSETLNESNELKCPSDGLLVKYDRPFSDERVESCRISANGDFIQHGPTRYFSKSSNSLIREEMFDKGNKIR